MGLLDLLDEESSNLNLYNITAAGGTKDPTEKATEGLTTVQPVIPTYEEIKNSSTEEK